MSFLFLLSNFFIFFFFLHFLSLLTHYFFSPQGAQDFFERMTIRRELFAENFTALLSQIEKDNFMEPDEILSNQIRVFYASWDEDRQRSVSFFFFFFNFFLIFFFNF